MIILSAFAGGLVYLGLAVLGWGGFAAFFAHPARLALAAVLFVLTATALFSQGNPWRASARTAVTAGLSARSA